MQPSIEDSVNLIYNKFISKRENEGAFVCPYENCRKAYHTEESLHRHLHRHSTQKEHRCTFCNKAFLRKSECEIHMRIHTGVKPFTCQLCHKQFARSTDLKIHTIYHSNEKPFKCPFPGCTLGFKRKSDAKKHLRIHVKKSHCEVGSLIQNHQSAFRPIPQRMVHFHGQTVILEV